MFVRIIYLLYIYIIILKKNYLLNRRVYEKCIVYIVTNFDKTRSYKYRVKGMARKTDKLYSTNFA